MSMHNESSTQTGLKPPVDYSSISLALGLHDTRLFHNLLYRLPILIRVLVLLIPLVSWEFSHIRRTKFQRTFDIPSFQLGIQSGRSIEARSELCRPNDYVDGLASEFVNLRYLTIDSTDRLNRSVAGGRRCL